MTKNEMLKYANDLGLFVATYSPGDGATRYRFFRKSGNAYFGSGIYTACGKGEAETFLSGYACGLGTVIFGDAVTTREP